MARHSDHISDLNASFSQPNLIPEDWQGDGKRQAAETSSLTAPDSRLQQPAYFDDKPPHEHGGRVAEHIPEQAQTPSSGKGSVATGDEAQLRNALAEGLGLSRTQLDELPLPELLETERLPCFATRPPAAAATMALAVEILNVLAPSPPVPQRSMAS